MQCDTCREILSAALDGEADATTVEVDAHLEGCEACLQWRRAAETLHRSLRVRPAEPVPDLTTAVLAAVRAPEPRWRQWPRYALLSVALTQLVMAMPSLVLGQEPNASVHVAREIGAWDLALAVGLLVAAWQPRRAAGLLPMGIALGTGIALTAVLDMFDGRAGAAGEAHHLLDVVGIVLLWCLTRPEGTSLVPTPRRPLVPLAEAA